MPEIDVSILIPSYNGRDMLLQCLDAVFRHTRDVSHEVIVVDNGSSDGTDREAPARFPSIRLERLDPNRGFVGACNFGNSLARGKYLLLLSNDVFLENNFVKILSDFMDARPRCGATGGALRMRSSGDSESCFGAYPSVSEAASDALLLPVWAPKLCTPARFGKVSPEMEPFTAEYITGADLMVRRELLPPTGPFDTRFSAYYEDVDLCRRVWDSGHEVWIVPQARGVHVGSATYGRDPRGKINLQCASTGKFLRKYHGPAYTRLAQALYAWTRLVKVAVRFVQSRLSAPGTEARRRYEDDLLVHRHFLGRLLSNDGW